jgi:hypothetical protein
MLLGPQYEFGSDILADAHGHLDRHPFLSLSVEEGKQRLSINKIETYRDYVDESALFSRQFLTQTCELRMADGNKREVGVWLCICRYLGSY